MRSKDYWKQSLSEVLPEVTDKIVEDIMNIAEMEYEYTNSPSPKKEIKDGSGVTALIKENETLKREFAKKCKADWVIVKDDIVLAYNK